MIATILMLLGLLLLCAGVISLILWRRIARNLTTAGLVRDGGRVPMVYAICVGVIQILLGCLFVALPITSPPF